MNLLTALMLGVAGCLVLSYGMGQPIVIVFKTDDDRRDMIWFVVIAVAMLGVLTTYFS